MSKVAFLKSSHILQIVQFEVEKFRGFCESISTLKLFQWNSLCNRLWPCKTTIQPWKFSSELQFSSATTKLFHLAIYGTVQQWLLIFVGNKFSCTYFIRFLIHKVLYAWCKSIIFAAPGFFYSILEYQLIFMKFVIDRVNTFVLNL